MISIEDSIKRTVREEIEKTVEAEVEESYARLKDKIVEIAASIPIKISHYYNEQEARLVYSVEVERTVLANKTDGR